MKELTRQIHLKKKERKTMDKTDKIRFSSIVWDTEGEEGIDLPLAVEATFTSKDYEGLDSIKEVESMYADTLAGMTGFHPKDFCYKPIA